MRNFGNRQHLMLESPEAMIYYSTSALSPNS
jgi:hypothetical protein